MVQLVTNLNKINTLQPNGLTLQLASYEMTNIYHENGNRLFLKII
jgi:hypothetical protein